MFQTAECRRYLKKMETPLNKYFEYCDTEIDGWDLMSWAVQVDPETIEDKEALKELVELDDFYANGYHEHVERLVHRTIPRKERKCKGELYIDAALENLKQGVITPKDFVSQFVKSFLYDIEQLEEQCSEWITTVFNENNGYGFLDLEEMQPSILHKYIKEKIDNQKVD